jgi:hypothetical protein
VDEKTVRVALQIPEDMIGFLERLSRRQGFEARKTGRAIRWCIREEMKREYDKAEEELLREMVEEGDPPADIDKNRISAADAFPDDLPKG